MTLKQRLFRLARPFVRTYFRVTRPLTVGVRGMVFDEAGRVLLVRHTYVDGWYLPGGGVDRGETVYQAVARELDEEVGVTVHAEIRPFGLYANFREFKSDHVVLFCIGSLDYTIRPRKSPEIAEKGFFSLHDLPGGISPGTRRRIEEVTSASPPAVLW